MTVTDRSAHLDRSGVRRAFDRASTRYDDSAILQARVRTELLERLKPMRLEPRVVLDLGAGTGQGALGLKRLFRRATVIALDIAPGMLREVGRHNRPWRRILRVCADAFALPLPDDSVDVVCSSLMLQWCDDLDAVLAEIGRVLRPGGFLSASTLGPDTLRELRAAWAAADAHSHVNVFLDMHDVGDALARAGFAEPVLDVERVTLTYAEVPALVRDLKTIGAHNVTTTRSKGLTGRATWRAMTAEYERYRKGGRLPASYEVIYTAAWSTQPAAARPVTGTEVHVSPNAIRRTARDRRLSEPE